MPVISIEEAMSAGWNPPSTSSNDPEGGMTEPDRAMADFEAKRKTIQGLIRATQNPLLILFDSGLTGDLAKAWSSLRTHVEYIFDLRGSHDDDEIWKNPWRHLHLVYQGVFRNLIGDERFEKGRTFARVDLAGISYYLEELPRTMLGPEWEKEFELDFVAGLIEHRIERGKAMSEAPQQTRSRKEREEQSETLEEEWSLEEDQSGIFEPVAQSIDAKIFASSVMSGTSLKHDASARSTWDPTFTYADSEEEMTAEAEGIKGKAERIEQKMFDIRDPLLTLFDSGLWTFGALRWVWKRLERSLSRREVERLLGGDEACTERWKEKWSDMHVIFQDWFDEWIGDAAFDEEGRFADVNLVRLSLDLEKLPLSVLGPDWEKNFDADFFASLRRHRIEREKARDETPSQTRERKDRQRDEAEFSKANSDANTVIGHSGTTATSGTAPDSASSHTGHTYIQRSPPRYGKFLIPPSV